MRIQPSMLIVPLLATVLMNPVIRGIWEPSSDAPRSSRVDLAQLPAPTGHRQPTLNDLPPWLRDEEKPGAEASPTQDPQAGRADVEQRDRSNKQPRTPRVQPDGGVPRICNPCYHPSTRHMPVEERRFPPPWTIEDTRRLLTRTR